MPSEGSSDVYRRKARRRPTPIKNSIADRALQLGRALSDAELPYAPSNTDWLILAAVLNGAVFTNEIAKQAQLTSEEVLHRMLQPAFARWLSQQVEAELPHRLGLVDLAVYSRALKTGDVSRARYLAERFGKMRRRAASNHLHLHLSLEKLSDEQLQRLVEEKRRLLGLVNENEQTEQERTPAPGSADTGGTGEAAEEGPASSL